MMKPCPFCGCELSKYPVIMLIYRNYDADFVKYMHSKGNFVGSNDYRVYCPKCGARGSGSPIKEKAVELWNRRNENEHK